MITVSAVATSLALFGYTAKLLIHYSHTNTLADWIPAVALHLALFFGAFGIQSLHWTISIETMPGKIRDQGVIFCGAFFWMFVYTYHAIVRFFMYSGDGGIELISGIVCLVGAVIIHFMLPETKGKSRQEIMKSF